MGPSWLARPLVLVVLLSLAVRLTRTQTTYDSFLDQIEGVLNGSVPIGKVDSILFTQANQYNLYLSNKAGSKSTSPRSAFQSNSLPNRPATAADDGSGSGSGGGSGGGSGSSGGGSGSSGSSTGPILSFFLSFFGFGGSSGSSRNGWKYTPPPPALSTLRTGVQWLSSNATVSKSNQAKLNTILKLLKQPSLKKALGTLQSTFFIPADSNVTLEADGVTNLAAAQATVPVTVPGPGQAPGQNSGQVSGQSYAQSFSQSYGRVEVQGHDDEGERRGGRQYRVECDDDDREDDDEPECVEPTGRVRIIKYTSPENVSYVVLRAKSKCLTDVRKVQIRNAAYGKTGSLVMEIPGSWRLVDDEEIELVKHTFIVNASSVTVSNGQTMEKAIQSMTKAPWNYYVIFTTGSKPSGAMRGQFWKPFCPWCANFTFAG